MFEYWAMEEPGRSDDELIAVAREDPSAFGQIYERHSEAVLRYLVYRTGSARRRRIDDRARRRLGIERLDLTDQELERVEELADLERAGARLETLVEDLPPAEREAVLARVVRERSYLELAETLGVSRETARKRVSRGLARLASWARQGQR